MASCTRIDNALQAYLDDELSPSERLILEEHIEECRACRRLLKNHQRASALLFETFGEHKLRSDFVPTVLENLPEMDRPVYDDVAGLNRRAKHPRPVREQVFRFMPFAAAVLLIVLAAVINKNWPEPPISQAAVGVVTAQQGATWRSGNDSARMARLHRQDIIERGDDLSTGADGALLVTLAGPTEIRIAPESQVVVQDDRGLTIHRGRVALDVNKQDRGYRVSTPDVDITVFGTKFLVDVTPNSTTVVVEEGDVGVRHKTASHLSRSIGAGWLVECSLSDTTTMTKERVDARRFLDWADLIQADPAAMAFFEQNIAPRYEFKEVRSGQDVVYYDVVKGEAVKSIQLFWDNPDLSDLSRRCAYDIWVFHVKNNERKVLFQGTIGAEILRDPAVTSYVITNTQNPEETVSNLFVQHIPLTQTGTVETEFDTQMRIRTSR